LLFFFSSSGCLSNSIFKTAAVAAVAQELAGPTITSKEGNRLVN
jgi:hypothetical protein